mgnify:CR=1 FL=1
MRTIDDLKRWKGYGFVMTPVNKDKTPYLNMTSSLFFLKYSFDLANA